MLVKNLDTGIVWSVAEEHGDRLLRSGDFEKVEVETPKAKRTSKAQNAESEK
ncbi:hypothetical protein SFC08_01815 [Lysinibacillus halotolerans]